MRITSVLWGGPCTTGDDCDTVYETDGEDVVVRGRYLSAEDADALGLTLPAHEGLLLIPRQAIGGDKAA